jgi:hypothetical protein
MAKGNEWPFESKTQITQMPKKLHFLISYDVLLNKKKLAQKMYITMY